MTAFKVGDKVRFNDSYEAQYVHGWRREHGYPVTHGDDTFTVIETYANGNVRIQGAGLNTHSWAFDRAQQEVWSALAFSLVQTKPTLADDLRLRPQDRTVLAHLKAGKPISPMKALVVYGISRLAACIHNIRKAGYIVNTDMEHDESGHKYASYKLQG